MKLVTFEHQQHVKIGSVQNERVFDLSRTAPDMLSLIELGPAGLALAQDRLDAGTTPVPLAAVRLLAPIPVPRRNVICLGRNYAAHAAESDTARGRQTQLPEVPVVFTKATTAVNGPFDDIPYDPAVSVEIDWEVELGVIIGKKGKNIPAAAAMDYVFGYTIINDVSARDLQNRGKQFFKGKSLDGHCPCGPWIVTADEIPDPGNLHLACRVNGTTKQDDTTGHMIFDVPTTIAYLSRGMTLLPGDIIATGTPSGVGFARTPPEFLQPGDVLESEIEGIGTLRNQIAIMNA